VAENRKIRFVSGHQSQTMHVCRGRKKTIHDVYASSRGLAARFDLSPGVGNENIDRRNAVLKTQRQLFPEPCVQRFRR